MVSYAEAGKRDEVELSRRLFMGSPPASAASGKSVQAPKDDAAVADALALSMKSSDLLMAVKEFRMDGDPRSLNAAMALIDGVSPTCNAREVARILKERYL